MNNKKCLVGELVDTKCGVYQFLRKEIDVKDLSNGDRKNLSYKVPNFPDEPVGFICPYHKIRFLDQYFSFGTKCSNPFNKHKIMIKTSLREVTIEICEHLYEVKNLIVAPGNEVCTNCLKSITDEITTWKIKLITDRRPAEKTSFPIMENKYDSQTSSTTGSEDKITSIMLPAEHFELIVA